MPATDAQLIDAAQKGDRLAAGKLLERHRRVAYSVAYQALRNVDDAYDVSQEALVYALQRLPDLRDPARFPWWLRRITLSCCADYRSRRRTRCLGRPDGLRDAASVEADCTDRLAVQRALGGLSDSQCLVMELRYVGGWSVQEVASLLAVPANTVRSRIGAAKRLLRADLRAVFPERMPMPVKTAVLTDKQDALLQSAFQGAQVLSVERDPMPWMPFSPRVRIGLPDGTERVVDFRHDIDADRAQLLAVLSRLGIPGPRLLAGPVGVAEGRTLCLCEPPAGTNLHVWALEGTAHRVRIATERTFEAVDRLQAASEGLLADPIAARLSRRTLADEAALLTQTHGEWPSDPWYQRLAGAGSEWARDPWFAAALERVGKVVADIRDPLVYTDYLHFNPYFLYVHPSVDPPDAPLGWPGDTRLQMNPIAEHVSPFGHFGDPLLGLAMMWIYDCYPFVHTGFVEQYLWRHNVSRRDFAPRLAVKALQTLRRELPAERQSEGGEYWDALHGYVEQALVWMG